MKEDVDVTFESQMIDTYKMLDFFIATPLKFVGAYVLICIVLKVFSHGRGEKIVETFTAVLFLLFKAFLYGGAACLAFFFNFDTMTIHFVLPEKMLLSTFLVGAFSIYECIANVAALISEIAISGKQFLRN